MPVSTDIIDGFRCVRCTKVKPLRCYRTRIHRVKNPQAVYRVQRKICIKCEILKKDFKKVFTNNTGVSITLEQLRNVLNNMG